MTEQEDEREAQKKAQQQEQQRQERIRHYAEAMIRRDQLKRLTGDDKP